MPSEFISITLFIAPNGDFIHGDKHNMDSRMIVRPMLEPTPVADEYHADGRSHNKFYVRHSLKFPCSEMEGQRIRTWPCGAWDNFLRRAIMDREQKGDAPWKK